MRMMEITDTSDIRHYINPRFVVNICKGGLNTVIHTIASTYPHGITSGLSIMEVMSEWTHAMHED